MNKDLQQVCDLLDDLASTVLNGSIEDRDFSEIHGWSWPSVSRHSLSNIPKSLSEKIKAASVDTVDKELEDNILEAISNIKNLKQFTVPYIYNGNGAAAIPLYISSMMSVTALFDSMLAWKSISDNKLLPPSIVRRLNSIEATINEITPKKEELTQQINLINEATEAATDLPINLQSLRESKSKVENLATSSAELFGKINKSNEQVDEAVKSLNQQSTSLIQSLNSKNSEAQNIVKQCEEAYRITTSTGLAAAFDERARISSNAVTYWVLCLVASLGASAWIGSQRVTVLSSLINVSDPHWGVIWLNIVLSILSIGAPIWFAWLATKQINQRFRLSEDYAFKASVAKAYEGYRREAARIDPLFEARLFSSALTRLEEAPLRFVSDDIHGSPWHELFASKPFQDALNTIPEFKDTIIQTLKDKLPNLNKETLKDIQATVTDEESVG